MAERQAANHGNHDDDDGYCTLPELARYLSFGASPRASINMVLGAKAVAFLRGRDYALPSDVQELAKDVLRHRVVLSYEALADDVSPDALNVPEKRYPLAVAFCRDCTLLQVMETTRPGPGGTPSRIESRLSVALL